MLNLILTIVVCWSFISVVNGQNRRDVPKYLPTTQMMNHVVNSACMTAATIDEPKPVLTLSFRFKPGNQRTTSMDYRKMVVMRNVLTQSTHPPQVRRMNSYLFIAKSARAESCAGPFLYKFYLTFYTHIIKMNITLNQKNKTV